VSLEYLKNKLALGTVQLGLSYGINNKTGKPSQQEADRILDSALEENITMLDSAEAYGESLHVIGSYLHHHPKAKFNIISKFVENGESILEKFNSSLKILNNSGLYAYMYHRFDDYQLGRSKSTLLRLRDEGKIKKIGVSVYSIEELMLIVQDPDVDLVQLPFNLFDASEEKKTIMADAKSKRKEIHVRSIFLQGLFFKRPGDLTGNLQELFEPLSTFQRTINKYNLTIIQACLNFALHNPLIDKVIIGVETVAQLKQNLDALLSDFPTEVVESLESIEVSNRALLNPSKWQL
jgi:aryl-alcohol dehydrogenase-like predicted oxidoreductase